MMKDFRKLSNNIFFKIFLGILALSFVSFGVSGFIFGGSSSWVAKVGGEKISYIKYQRYLQSEKEAIFRSGYAKNKEVIQYLNSEKFKSDILGKMVNEVLINKLQKEFGVYVDKNVILAIIAKDRNFQGVDGKFNPDLFETFLTRSGIKEDQYLQAIQNEIASTIILDSLSVNVGIDEKIANELADYNKEQRKVDLYTVSTENVAEPQVVNQEKLIEFFQENKSKFTLPEIRDVSYISFSQDVLSVKTMISDEEVTAKYDSEKERFQKPELRNFYHILFDDKQKADSFLKALNDESLKDKKVSFNFIALGKKMAQKTQSELVIEDISRKDLMAELATPAFSLGLNKYSEVLKSSLGYHIFLVNKIVPAKPIPFAEVKESIKKELLLTKQEDGLKNKISQIEDDLLTSNSLDKIANQLGLKVIKNIKIDKDGKNLSGQEVAETKKFDQFIENTFIANSNQTSKLYYSKTNKSFYAIYINKIELSRQQELKEIESQVLSLFKENQKKRELLVLSKEIRKKLSENLGNDSAIVDLVRKDDLKAEYGQVIPRFVYSEGGGQKAPYANDLSKEVFATKIGKVTNPIVISDKEVVIAVVKGVEKHSSTEGEVQAFKSDIGKKYQQEMMQEFNLYLQAKYPVEVNKELLGEDSGS